MKRLMRFISYKKEGHMKEAYLSIQNLVITGEDSALEHFNLHLARGESLELLGTESSGLARAADFFQGKAVIQKGYVCIGEQRYYPGDTLEGADIQYMGETPSLAGALTVAENILLLSKKTKRKGLLRKKEILERASFLLSEFGIRVRAEEKAEYLSETEKRFVELLRAAEQEIPLLVIGDIFATAGQTDLQFVASCLRLLKERGTTILILGSWFPHFFDLDDRVEVLRNGRCVRTFYRETFDRESFVRWMLGIESPMLAREELIQQVGKEQGQEPYASIIHKEEISFRGGKEDYRLVICALSTEGLQDFDLSVLPGELLGLYDMHNRANRELLRCLSGDQKPEKGALYLDGTPYVPSSLRDAVSAGVDLIPRSIDQCSVIDNLSYTDNLRLSTLRKGSYFGMILNSRISSFLAQEYGQEILAESPGTIKGKDLAREDRMRVVLQRILLHRPRVLLVEDTVSDMNLPLLKLQIDYFSRLKKEGCSILISSPNLSVLRQISDRVIVLNSMNREP